MVVARLSFDGNTIRYIYFRFCV